MRRSRDLETAIGLLEEEGMQEAAKTLLNRHMIRAAAGHVFMARCYRKALWKDEEACPESAEREYLSAVLHLLMWWHKLEVG